MGYMQIESSLVDGYSLDKHPQLPDDVSFIDGSLINANLPNPLRFEIACPSDEHPGHFFEGVLPVVSDLFVDLMRSAGIDNFQLFPAVLYNGNGTEWKGYNAMNVVGLLDSLNIDACADLGLIMPGSGDSGPPELLDVPHPVIDPLKVKGLLMFREVRSPSLLVFDDCLEEQFKQKRPPEGFKITVKRLKSAAS